MADSNLIPLAKTDLGPAAQALVERVAAGIGVLWRPIDTVQQAKADVEAAKIRAAGEIAVQEVRNRALARLTFEEIRNQDNLEAIYGKTIAMLEPGIDPENVKKIDEDWLFFHSERARLFSDDEMQTLFAKILAEEVRQPGFFPRRTVQILSILEKEEAALFTTVCSFVVIDKQGPTPAIFLGREIPKLYLDNGITPDGLYTLNSVGLLKFTSPFLTDNVHRFDADTSDVTYFGETRTYRLPPINPPKDNTPYIHYGYVQFTDIGLSLSRIAGGRQVPGFFDYLETEWVQKKIGRV